MCSSLAVTCELGAHVSGCGLLSGGVRALNSPLGMGPGQQGWLLSLGFCGLLWGPWVLGKGGAVGSPVCALLGLWAGGPGAWPISWSACRGQSVAVCLAPTIMRECHGAQSLNPSA